jgi:preprotein translocase subunit SecE
MKNVTQFLHEVRSELSKVVWPKFNSFVESTIVVLVLVLAFALYLWVIDRGFSRAMEYIFRHYG